MKKISFTLMFLWAVCCFAEKGDPIVSAIHLYEYEDALHLIEEAASPDKYIFYQVQALKGLNRYREAISALHHFLEKEPENLRGLLELGECYKYTGNFFQALQLYEKISGLNPENNYAQIQYINLLLQNENYETAREKSKSLIEEGKNYGYRLLGQAYEGLKQADSAMVCYQQAVEIQPTDHLPMALLANLYNNANEFDKAIACTERFRELDSLNLSVNRQNAKAYCLSKDYCTAIERYKQLVASGDRSYLTNYYLGVSYYAEDLFFEAQEFLDKAYRKEPKNTNLLYYLGRSSSKTSWKKEGVEYLEKALEYTIPTDSILARLYRGLADCYKLAGQYPEQINALKKLMDHDPASSRSCLYSIGAIYQDQLQQNKNAIRYLEAFMRTRPDNLQESYLREDMVPIITEDSYYKAAGHRLKKLKEEEFFQEGNKE